jgi:hypothetical protein
MRSIYRDYRGRCGMVLEANFETPLADISLFGDNSYIKDQLDSYLNLINKVGEGEGHTFLNFTKILSGIFSPEKLI